MFPQNQEKPSDLHAAAINELELARKFGVATTGIREFLSRSGCTSQTAPKIVGLEKPERKGCDEGDIWPNEFGQPDVVCTILR